jgi:hypothetical integral membrane protein (TIGR02206 family)
MTDRPFIAFGLSHWCALALFAGGALALVMLGRRWRGSVDEQRFSRGFAIVNLLLMAPLQIWSMLPGQWDVRWALPLQLCDWAWAVSALALWTRGPRAHALLYYWGLTLSSQALLTPGLDFDFPSLTFLMFWAMHLMVVWAAIYLTWGAGLRPDWRGYRFALAVTLLWASLAFVVNSLTGANYGFLAEKPPVKTLLDALGPWPVYLVSGFALIASIWALITWPWTRLSSPQPGK